jgi:signal transduction histidine kinase/CheY-like chemotaxis protein
MSNLRASVFFTVLLVLAALSPLGWANVQPGTPMTPVVILDGVNHYELTREMYYLNDSAYRYTADKILANFATLPWQRVESAAGATGVTGGQVWYAVSLLWHEDNIEEGRWIFKLNNPNLDQVDFLWRDNTGVLGQIKTGLGAVHNELMLFNRDYVFPLNFTAGKPLLLLVRASDINPVYIAPSLFTEDHFSFVEQNLQLFYGFVIGLMFLMVLYNSALGYATRDLAFAGYVVLIISYFFVVYTIEGFFNQYVWGHLPQSVYALEVARSVVSFTAPLFTILFFRLDQRRSFGFYFLLVPMVLSGVNLLLVYLELAQLTTIMDRLLGMLAYLGCAIVGGFALWRREQGALMFTLAWSLTSVAIMANRFALTSDIVNITVNQATFYIECFVVLEMIMLSLALSGRIKKLQLERITAEAKSQTKTQFLAKVGHELRTPLNGIIGLTELMGDYVSDAKGRTYLKTIRQSGNYLSELINDLLDISKIEEDKIELETISFNIRQLTDSLVETFVYSNSSYRGRIESHVDENVPLYLQGDPTRIRQIITNFLSNAIKFTREGQIDINVTVTSTHRIKIAVEDTGVGIPKDKLEKIFGLFEQENSSTARQYGGTGLGLSISKMLAELMGGEIGVDSVLGAGAEFWVELPLMTAPSIDSLPRRPVEESAQQAAEKLNILIVEDNLVNQLVVKNMLLKLGHHVTVKENGQLAVDSYQANSSAFDLILMDCDMPVMDGYQATRAIREFEGREQLPAVSIVALTADALSDNVQRCMDCGMDSFLSKPVTMETLASTLVRYRFSSEGVD